MIISKLSVIFLFFFLDQISSETIELSDENWRNILTGEWMIKFYAPWCPACKSVRVSWKDFSSWSEDIGISVGQIDATKNPGLSGRFLIGSFPTFYHVKDGVFRRYNGQYETKAWLRFVEDGEYLSVEPLPWYQDPGRFHMGALSTIFELSLIVKNVHDYFTEDLGIHPWMSYVIFGCCTALLGIVLGLILVVFIDCLVPIGRPPRVELHPNSNASNEELDGSDDDIPDNEDRGRRKKKQ